MTAVDNRIEALHARMEIRRRARERRKTVALGMCSSGLALCLLLFVFGEDGTHAVGFAGLYNGTTILFENAGGYVLTAVIAFMVGVLITVLCIRSRR